MAVLIATEVGVVPTDIGEPSCVGVEVGCTARLAAAIDPFGEPVPQTGIPLGGQETLFTTAMGYSPGPPLTRELSKVSFSCRSGTSVKLELDGDSALKIGTDCPLNRTFTTEFPWTGLLVLASKITFVVPK
jgi:hypothetical protein